MCPVIHVILTTSLREEKNQQRTNTEDHIEKKRFIKNVDERRIS
jgi:hypothetical protein